MMRLPARLTTQLAKARIARMLKSAPAGSLIQFVDSAEVLHPGSGAPVSHEKMQKLLESHAPVIWIGGSEPLLHPGISHFVRAIAQSGHFVFLETDGTLLRRRIHEFQPIPGLFLTVRLAALDAPESALAIEGLRTARLSGFFTVIHSLIRDDADLTKLKRVRSFVLEHDVDGWLVTAAFAENVLTRKTDEARGLIPSWFWRRFSRRVEKAMLAQATELRPSSSGESPDEEAPAESVKVA